MTENLTILATVHLFMSFLLAAFTLYFSLQCIHRFVFKRQFGEPASIAESIFSSGIVLSVGVLIEGITSPILNTLRSLENLNYANGKLFLETFKYSSVFTCLALVVAITIVLMSMLLYMTLTKKTNEIKEIKNNNIPVAILTSTIVFALAFIVKDSMILLIESIIPYPKLPEIYGGSLTSNQTFYLLSTLPTFYLSFSSVCFLFGFIVL